MPITRFNGHYTPGKYRVDNRKIGSAKKATASKVQRRARPSSQINQLVNTLNYTFYSLLKPRKGNLIKSFKVLISMRLFNFLKQSAGSLSDFFSNYNLIKERQINPVNLIRIDESLFYFKLFKRKGVLVGNRLIQGPCYLYVKLRKKEIVLN